MRLFGVASTKPSVYLSATEHDFESQYCAGHANFEAIKGLCADLFMRPSFFQSVRFPVSIGVVFLSLFLFGQARTVWRKYWILRDGRRSTALVTRKYGHELVDYSFHVNGKEYKGTDREKYVSQEHRYEDVTLGGEAVVYFSSSHPWLSSLARPDSILPDGFLGYRFPRVRHFVDQALNRSG